MTLHSVPVAYGPAGLAGAVEGEADALVAERELVRRTQQGDTAAFDGLVRRHLRQARIVRAAGARLRQLRERPCAWWEWAALWAHLLVPLGLAASLAAGVLLLRYDTSAETTLREAAASTTTAPVTLRGLMFGVATGTTTAPDLADALVAQPSDEWLFARAMRY